VSRKPFTGLRKLLPLSEADAYGRCYGERDDTVRIVARQPWRPRRYPARISGEELRERFEERLAAREPVEDA
jgi:hypothetical protein